jgi:hypothetical protein
MNGSADISREVKLKRLKKGQRDGVSINTASVIAPAARLLLLNRAYA